MERALEPDVPQDAEAVLLAGEQHTDVDVRPVHVREADRRVLVDCRVDLDVLGVGRRLGNRLLDCKVIRDAERAPDRRRCEHRPGVHEQDLLTAEHLAGLDGGRELLVGLTVRRVDVRAVGPVELLVLANVRVHIDDGLPVVAHEPPPPYFQPGCRGEPSSRRTRRATDHPWGLIEAPTGGVSTFGNLRVHPIVARPAVLVPRHQR
jgi:hypothetical protein